MSSSSGPTTTSGTNTPTTTTPSKTDTKQSTITLLEVDDDFDEIEVT